MFNGTLEDGSLIVMASWLPRVVIAAAGKISINLIKFLNETFPTRTLRWNAVPERDVDLLYMKSNRNSHHEDLTNPSFRLFFD